MSNSHQLPFYSLLLSFFFFGLWRVKLRNETFILSARIRLQTQNNPCVFSWWYFFFLSEVFCVACVFVACCAEYRLRVQRAEGKNTVYLKYHAWCFDVTLVVFFFRMQSVERTRENLFSLLAVFRLRCATRHKNLGEMMSEDYVTEEDTAISLCFHFEFSNATDNPTFEKTFKPHSTINTKHERKKWNQKAFT